VLHINDVMKGTLKSAKKLQKQYIGKIQSREKRPLNRFTTKILYR